METETYVVYHRGDLDGKCSAAIALRKYPSAITIGVEYGDDAAVERIEDGARVVMVDFCLQPFDRMLRLNARTDLTWIDHHKTSIEEYDRAVRETGLVLHGKRAIGDSACELAWQWFLPLVDMPQSVRLLGRYDVWDQSDEVLWHERILPFQMGMRAAEINWPEVFCWNNENLMPVIQDGRAIMAYQRAEARERLDQNGFLTRIGDTLVCALNGGEGSRAFDAIDEVFLDCHCPAIVKIGCAFTWTGRCWTVSLYDLSGGEIDVSAIAKAHGGGGHAGAAGFTCAELPFELRELRAAEETASCT